MIARILFCSFLVVLSGCGGGGGSSDSGTQPVLESSNPITQTQYFGTNGNLWKPASDGNSSGTGNLVVLLSPEYTTQFDGCHVTLRNGSIAPLICINDQDWTQIPFSCFSNGGRQTWRANFRCSEVGEVKVTCYDQVQEIDFTVADELRYNVCSRFG